MEREQSPITTRPGIHTLPKKEKKRKKNNRQTNPTPKISAPRHIELVISDSDPDLNFELFR